VYAGVLCLLVPFLSVGSPQSRTLSYHTGWTSNSYPSTSTFRDWVAGAFKCLYYYYFSMSRHSSEWNQNVKGWKGVSTQLCACSCADECWSQIRQQVIVKEKAKCTRRGGQTEYCGGLLMCAAILKWIFAPREMIKNMRIEILPPQLWVGNKKIVKGG